MKWICSVCNHVHEGNEAPDKCPICGQPKDKFEPQKEEPDGSNAKASRSDRWRCIVCQHVGEGSSPPDVCPVCGAGKDSFVPETASVEHHHHGIPGLIEKLHLHPIAAHFPNGALPLSLIAWTAYLLLGDSCLERSSFYLLLASTAAVPFTALFGWSDAKHRFHTTSTGVFPEKKVFSWLLFLLTAATAGWRLNLGWEHVPAGTMEVALYSGLVLASTAVAGRLGMLGGKLVFGH